MNIALTGMMGSGKSTIGKLLQARLKGYVFVDTDLKIIEKENLSINEIFSKYGEEYFRKSETETLKDVLKSDNQIISTGGGIIKSEENINLLKQNSTVFYLKASPDVLYERVKNNKERPLLNTDNISDKIKILLKERESNYNKADYIINTDNKLPEEITEEIAGIINGTGRS
jgi:shikimate kinase